MGYDEQSFLGAFFTGLFIVIAFVAVLSIPGWIVAAVWGWTWFFRGAGVFWIGVMGVTLIVFSLAAIGSND